jgi:hypothetical protein
MLDEVLTLSIIIEGIAVTFAIMTLGMIKIFKAIRRRRK